MSGLMRLTAAFVLAVLMTPQSVAWDLSMDEARAMAKCLYGECRGESTMEQAAVAWTVLNRVDDPRFPDTITEVIIQPGQFTGYRRSNPVDDELLDLAMDVIIRWQMEKSGEAEVGRVLPKEYVYFIGRNGRNYFGYEWPVSETWDWSAEDPYQDPEEDEPIGLEENENGELDEFLSNSGYRTFDWVASDSSRSGTRTVRRVRKHYPDRY